MKLFDVLVEIIDEFEPDNIGSEYKLERNLKYYLEDCGFQLSEQLKQGKLDRYDLVCRKDNERVCIELKLKASTSDIQQFDKYLPKFKDGLIVVCWQATNSLREIFSKVILQSPTPIKLIELSKNYGLA